MTGINAVTATPVTGAGPAYDQRDECGGIWQHFEGVAVDARIAGGEEPGTQAIEEAEGERASDQPQQIPAPEDHQGEFGWGDVWTFTAIDSDTKLVPTWLVGQRTNEDTELFIRDLASRLTERVQITTDAFGD